MEHVSNTLQIGMTIIIIFSKGNSSCERWGQQEMSRKRQQLLFQICLSSEFEKNKMGFFQPLEAHFIFHNLKELAFSHFTLN